MTIDRDSNRVGRWLSLNMVWASAIHAWFRRFPKVGHPSFRHLLPHPRHLLGAAMPGGLVKAVLTRRTETTNPAFAKATADKQTQTTPLP